MKLPQITKQYAGANLHRTADGVYYLQERLFRYSWAGIPLGTWAESPNSSFPVGDKLTTKAEFEHECNRCYQTGLAERTHAMAYGREPSESVWGALKEHDAKYENLYP